MQNAVKIADYASLDSEVDQAIAECGGDAREAVRALLMANAHLEVARDQALGLCSRGFVRGRIEPYIRLDGER
jgi:hypothetical protein